ncbi:low affinity iron permease family protein [Chryseolinea sp. H1M3-3]|uniref:low affinity iron permease family protein n=1 Tax=Chryseolinea sp. H1M3-3 TaxID=3034144 RepID=UPI0023EB6078|nr:low affinity iron permease family protein [Chryseolinea sp. H1M3-3]
MKRNGKPANGKSSQQSVTKIPHNKATFFDRISTTVTRAAGRPGATILAFSLIVIWALSGPIFNFSDTWQLVINTGTTIITFLMVFIIQQSQNKDTLALQLKLNELIACQELASNRLIDIEDLTEDELMVLKKFYVKLSDLAESENELYSSHSLDEATTFHTRKKSKRSGKA